MTIEQIRAASREYAMRSVPLTRRQQRKSQMQSGWKSVPVKHEPPRELTDAEYRAECLQKLSGPNPPAELRDSLVSHYMRIMVSRGVKASRMLGKVAMERLFSDILA